MKRIVAVALVLFVLVSLMSISFAAPSRLPGEGLDGEVNGEGHDWAEGTKKNQNENKLWEKDNPGYRNHLLGDGGNSDS